MITLTLDGAVATARMSRPPVNAIDHAFVAALDAVLGEVERAKPTVLVIESDQKCFSAGADLALIQSYFSERDGIERMIGYVRELHRVFDRIEALEAVTLAAIAAPALGGGLELALACDLRIAATTVKLGLPEARIGMIPGAGGTQRLPRLCGPGTAARLILGAEIIDGTEAERVGLAQWSVATDVLASKTAEIAERISALSRPALASCKACLAAALDPAIDGFAREIEQPLTLMKTREAKERIAAFFASRAG